jgi:aminoglycoside/choline kinase family phosphotransferase
VNSAGGHLVASVQNHFDGCVVAKSFCRAQHERRNARLRKFRRAAEAAVNWIMLDFENFRRAFQNVRSQRQICSAGICQRASSRA